jgi:hypothetical protein
VRDTPKFSVKLEHREKTSKGRPGQTRKKRDTEDFLRGTKWVKELYLETMRDRQLFVNRLHLPVEEV